ncbi:MAG: SpoIIE family protein phosphatase [Clostridia bacterium]|nr:SpoIIE family protein phosphatase [Clostridia bacterium]MBQ7339113.1 SpoIIE family protein phosphatase [Clostridia bacterium]
MEHQKAPPSRAARIKHWLLSRRHVLNHADEPLDNVRYSAWLRRGCCALLAWSLTRTPLLFSVNPLPAAFFVATPYATLATLLGILFGLWQGAPHPYLTLLSLGTGFLIRLILRLYYYPAGDENALRRQEYRRMFRQSLQVYVRKLCTGSAQGDTSENTQEEDSKPPAFAIDTSLPVSYRTLAAAVGGTIGAICLCISGDFAFYDLYGAAVFLLLSPLACALFSFSLDEKIGKCTPLRAFAGHGALLVAVSFCLRSITFLTISLAIALLLSFALYQVRCRGLLFSLCGVLLGGLAIDATVIPPLIITVLLYAFLQGMSERIALLVASIGGIASTLVGGESLFRQLAPSLCVGVLLMSVYISLAKHHARSLQKTDAAYHHDTTFAALAAERARSERLTARLCAMSGAFGGLCEVLLRMSDSLRRSSDSSTGSSPFDNRRESAHAESFAKDCSVMAGLLRDALAEDALTIPADDETATSLGQALREQGGQFRQITCLSGNGRCRVQIHGCSPAHIGLRPEQLHRIAEKVTGTTLRTPSYDGSGEDGGIYTLRPRPPLAVQCIYRSVAAGQWLTADGSLPRGTETKKAPGCGDTIRFFSDGQDHFFALLCDGMGTGEAAALTSGVSVLFLERMLRAGVGMDTALTLLNHYLYSREGEMAETTSTVDLLSLDLFSGKTRFVKSGAADTLILRSGQLFSVGCRTFPLGILSGVDVQVVPFTLEEGDCIFMMSDGIMDSAMEPVTVSVSAVDGEDAVPSAASASTEAKREEHWLYDLLGNAPPADDAAARALIERILDAAHDHGSVDDMTVAVLKIVAG